MKTNWRVGQNVVCDRPEQFLSGCTIQAADVDSILITCPTINVVVCGKQKNLEELGWRLADTEKKSNKRTYPKATPLILSTNEI